MPYMIERLGLAMYAADPVDAMQEINHKAFYALRFIHILSCTFGVVEDEVQRQINRYNGPMVGAEDARRGETVSLAVLTPDQRMEVMCRTMADLVGHSNGRKPPWHS